MSKERERASFSSLGSDIKEARQAMTISRRELAEKVNIDPDILQILRTVEVYPVCRFFTNW